ncbi:AlbA family DNA-binding domain-containing protein [Desulfovibrio inopinatus]|uniref:AlbA family DNA-binding domain-containing protein n=1 Tax=Desulfovibrio inopinatus TaxID=102109 RepID=UPI0004192854|nr:ATP-binding protein [Desulfovibrio inopinatus]
MKPKGIFTFLAVLLLVTLVLAGAFFYQQTENLSRSVVTGVAENSAKNLASAIKSFFEPFVSNSRFMADMFVDEGLATSSKNEVAPFAAALVASNAPLSGVMISDASGPLFILAQRENKLFVRGKGNDWHETTRQGVVGETVEAPFAVRFGVISSAVAALDGAPTLTGADRVYWSPSFLNNNGMAVSVTLDDPKAQATQSRQVRQILSLSFSIESMQDVIAAAKYSKQEAVFILASPRSGVDSSLGRTIDLFGKSAVLVPLSGSEKGDLLVEGAKNIMELNESLGGDLAVPVAGGDYFVGFSRLGESADSAYLGVVIPKTDLVDRFASEQTNLNRIGLSFLAAFGVVAIVLLMMYRLLLKRSAQDVTTSNMPVARLMHQGESEFVEFKSTLRVNLQTGKKDKRMELACLKTVAAFLNSRGGTLLVGVSDSGDVLGLENDDFSDDDHVLRHFANVFDQNIGPVHRRQVTTSVVNAEGGKILRVDCRASESPVFVKTADDDVFYVRTGPATKRLKMTEALEYMKTRFENV